MKKLSLVFVLFFGQYAYAQNRTAELRQELIEAYEMSEKYTLAICEQMPAEHYTYKTVDSVMTFTEQFRHCVVFTLNQISGRTGVKNPNEGRKLPVQMPKEQLIKEVKAMYAFVKKNIAELPEAKLYEKTGFTGGEIPMWRLFYAMENHIIHHRGQCIMYLRDKGVKPQGYFGW